MTRVRILFGCASRVARNEMRRWRGRAGIMLMFAGATIGACRRETAAPQQGNDASSTHVESICAITVFAASSLRDVTVDLVAEFRRTHPGCEVTQNYAASNKLGQQIEAGAKFDVFLSAAATPIDRAIQASAIDPATKRALFSNQLVLISRRGQKEGHRGMTHTFASVCDLGEDFAHRVAIGQPDAVPAGIYAREYLSRVGCRDTKTGKQISALKLIEGKLLPMPEVRAVVAVVARQPGTWGFVYKTDVTASTEVEPKLLIEGALAPEIAYYGALPPRATNNAKAFMDLLTREEGQRVLLKYGFVIGAS